VLDFILAIAHHLAVFVLVATLGIELVLVRPGLDGGRLKLLGSVDGLYGGLAGAVVVVGFLRVFFGEQGWDFYAPQWVFWAKIVAFVVVGLLSIVPTVAIIRWRRAHAADPAVLPDAGAIAGVRRWLWAEAAVLALIPIFANAMRKGWGL
jgi:putative membrane protein